MAGPLIVQSDLKILAEVSHPLYPQVRPILSRFSELVSSPEYIHTYVMSDVSIWNAISSGMGAEDIIKFLRTHSKYPLPAQVENFVRDSANRFGIAVIERDPEGIGLILKLNDGRLFSQVFKILEKGGVKIQPVKGELKLRFASEFRGEVKRLLTYQRIPPIDVAGYEEGTRLFFRLREITGSGERFSLRWYQEEAVRAFMEENAGSGVVVLPCGAGKTIVGIGIMEKIGSETLILATNRTAVHQWIEELLDKTTLSPDDVCEYSGVHSKLAPVTITTYHMLTYRRSRLEDFRHFRLFESRNWGLIIYDEVHSLPAPVFRITAQIQSKRRLGLTATLIREDGKEYDVFSLVGPKVYDSAWRGLEREGYIATLRCFEVRVPLSEVLWQKYISADRRTQFRIAAENPVKDDVAMMIVEKHPHDSILIIGHYLDQLRRIARRCSAPLITGDVLQKERDKLYREFREGKRRILVVSKVANFAINLPDASVAVQVSGTFGSRQEEAQRIGRILRPKKDGREARFYSLVSDETVELDYAEKRQLFLAQQGYVYEIIRLEDLKKVIKREA